VFGLKSELMFVKNVAVMYQAAKEQSGIQVEQSWTATSLDASMNASKPVSNAVCTMQMTLKHF